MYPEKREQTLDLTMVIRTSKNAPLGTMVVQWDYDFYLVHGSFKPWPNEIENGKEKQTSYTDLQLFYF